MTELEVRYVKAEEIREGDQIEMTDASDGRFWAPVAEINLGADDSSTVAIRVHVPNTSDAWLVMPEGSQHRVLREIPTDSEQESSVADPEGTLPEPADYFPNRGG